MKTLLLASSLIGSKSRTALNYAKERLLANYPESDYQLLDLAEMEVAFAKGYHYLDLTGDTRTLVQAIMDCDVLILASPIFQASIPASLKNVFDLLPQNSLQGKVVGAIITAGSHKHFLIPQYQLNPILNYMKASQPSSYVFAHDLDFEAGQLINSDVKDRIDRLITECHTLAVALEQAQEQEDQRYDF
ncbi:FMN reductase [Facklamia sp. HMSC062C11]|uniref:NADPH-dependent FMN reductase n=1 Tax=Facklamia hominis TaxID=178214 RepID=A0AAJ1Q5A1_9LACT|nr:MULTISPECIES: NADPH-dependent FMN reductase [Facklamia]MDK7187097.1 NADPH-dependent FMN reductase [Facklamia hominis]OFL67811.1 FMN reductase [Facklamia sp. HMSC062C11]